MQIRTLVSPYAAIGATLLLSATVAGAQPAPDVDTVHEASAPHDTPTRFALQIEPGLATALSDPQSQRTDAGFGQTVKVMFGLTRYLSVGPSVGFATLRSSGAMETSGTSWAFGGGARLMRPHDAQSFYGISPWIDADLLDVRTGSLDRGGFAGAAGLAVPLDDDRRFWLGPYARYFQILQGDPVGFDNRDAKILELGLSLEVDLGRGRRHESAPMVVVVASPTPASAPDPAPAAAPVAVADRDHDGVPDESDNCPDAAGPADNAGCPVYEKVVVKPDKLELEEKIAFAWSSAELDAASHPALDEVAKALNDNIGFTVRVDGNASSDGDDAYNQTLSDQRAAAVVDYLVAHGVARERLIAKGFSSSTPAASNSTAAGRITNRRVEFVVEFTIVKKAGTP